MRILHVVALGKWTGAAAVAWDWTQALRGAGVEAELAFVGDSHLSRKLLPNGAARPILTRTHGLISALVDSRRLAATLAREPFDIVHAHLSHDHYLAAAAVPANGARLVRTLHHVGQVRHDPMTRWLWRRTAALSYANSEIVEAAGLPGPVFSPTVDPARFAPGPKPRALLERLGLEGAPLVAGTVGKLARGRGHEEAMDAAAPLPGVSLVHVGMGEYRPALEARAARLGMAGRNVFAGYDEDGLPDLYRAMDVFLFPASGSQQGQRAVLEAMATGLPVLALPVPGVADLLTSGREGLVVADRAALSGALRTLAGDPALRERLGGAGRRRAHDFTAARFAAAAIPFYEGVLSVPSPEGEGVRASRGSPSGATSPPPSGGPAGSSRPDR